jgi:hypothetical protein
MRRAVRGVLTGIVVATDACPQAMPLVRAGRCPKYARKTLAKNHRRE